MSQEKQFPNEFRIGFKSNPKDVITQCEKILKEDKTKEVHLSAVANSIGELTIIVEILKSMIPCLSQKKILSVISPRSKEKDKKPEDKPKKLFPRIEFILSIDEKDKNNDNCPAKITEEERALLIDTLEKQKESFRKSRKSMKTLRKYRRWRTYSRKGRYSRPIRRNIYNRKKVNNTRRPFSKPPRGRNVNVKKTGSRKESRNKQASPVKN